MTHRVYCERLESPTVDVEDAEAHHLLHVLRIRVGAEVELFDGCGQVASGQVIETTRRSVTVQITRRWTDDTQQSGLTVAVSPPKGDRLKWMIEKLTELGVDRLILLQTQRTVVTPGEDRVDKLKASVVAACKQSRRNRLLDIQPLTPLTEVLLDCVRENRGKLFLAHPAAEEPATASRENRPPSEHQLRPPGILLIGPEGGFTEDEVSLCIGNGAVQVAWPNTILRIETAALAFSSAIVFSNAAVSGRR